MAQSASANAAKGGNKARAKRWSVDTVEDRTSVMKRRDEKRSEKKEEARIPIVEEDVRVFKREKTTGLIRVTTKVGAEERSVTENLRVEDVEVERVPIDREIDTAPSVRTEGDLTIIPVVEERIVIKKQLVLKEEVRIRRREHWERVEQPVTVRSMQAHVERVPASDPPAEPPPAGAQFGEGAWKPARS